MSCTAASLGALMLCVFGHSVIWEAFLIFYKHLSVSLLECMHCSLNCQQLELPGLVFKEWSSFPGWLYKNKDIGMSCTAASLGALMLWDVDAGLAEIDKYQWSTDNYVKAGDDVYVLYINMLENVRV